MQGFEDDLFLSYFNPIRILEGGVPTGFKHYTAPDWPKKLYWVQGASAKNIRVSELPIDVANLNSGDVFVLDLGMELHQFNGRQVRVALSWSSKGRDVSLTLFTCRLRPSRSRRAPRCAVSSCRSATAAPSTSSVRRATPRPTASSSSVAAALARPSIRPSPRPR